MDVNLKTWLPEELTRRGWSYSELARRAGLSQAAVSNVLAGNREAGPDFCIKIAQALGEAPEKLLRLAGILPASPASEDNALQELMEIARNLPPEDREELLKYARFRYQQRKD